MYNNHFSHSWTQNNLGFWFPSTVSRYPLNIVNRLSNTLYIHGKTNPTRKNYLEKEVLDCKQEIKNTLGAREVKLLLKIKSFNEKIRPLIQETTDLKPHIESLDRKTRKNNTLVYGLVKTIEETIFENMFNLLPIH